MVYPSLLSPEKTDEGEKRSDIEEAVRGKRTSYHI
jgi:hypothetical protein